MGVDMNVGRPVSKISSILFSSSIIRAEKYIEATIFLTQCCFDVIIRSVMPMMNDAIKAMEQRLLHECKAIQNIRTEMEELAPAYNRFLDLQKELATRHKRINRIQAVFGPNGIKRIEEKDKSDVVGNTLEVWPSPAQLREDLVLWEAIFEYLSTVPESSVIDIQTFLSALGITVKNKPISRQAIESAIRTHSDVFRVIKRKGEKFVSLKENQKA
jgi:hypothetical protein